MPSTISSFPAIPSRSTQDNAAFVAAMDQFLGHLVTFVAEANALAAAMGSVAAGAFSGTSATSRAIGTGTKTFTATTGLALSPGQACIVASAAAPATNWMTGTVGSYDPVSGALSVDVTVVGGAGTYADWAIGLLPDSNALLKSGGAMIGKLLLAASAAGAAGINLGQGIAPSAPVNGDLWLEAAGLFARIAGTTRQFSEVGHTHTSFANLALTGTPTAPTAGLGTSTTQIATTAFVAAALANLVSSAPGALDTLNELAAALGNDANFATTMTNALAGKASTGHTHASFTNLGLTDPVITGTIAEDIYTIVDGAAFEINPRNGSIQMITLGASRTPKATNMVNGESVTLAVDDGTAYTLTWTDATFGGAGVKWLGGSAPTLATTGYTWITLWKVGGQVYGSCPGSSA